IPLTLIWIFHRVSCTLHILEWLKGDYGLDSKQSPPSSSSGEKQIADSHPQEESELLATD
ncbi:unnamed protein product, partial [Allacma fusca]